MWISPYLSDGLKEWLAVVQIEMNLSIYLTTRGVQFQPLRLLYLWIYVKQDAMHDGVLNGSAKENCRKNVYYYDSFCKKLV